MIGNAVGGLAPARSVQRWVQRHKTTCDAGQLIPVFCQEVIPGQILKPQVEILVRSQELLGPLMDGYKIRLHMFFVPFRLTWPPTIIDGEMTDGYELFVTGGEDGTATPTRPVWDLGAVPADNVAAGKLWDYLGLPVGVVPPAADMPIADAQRAYALIRNEFYRLQAVSDKTPPDNNDILRCPWPADPFVSALEFQQRGTAPVIPLTGSASAVFSASAITAGGPAGIGLTASNLVDPTIQLGNAQAAANVKDALDNNTIDLSNLGTFGAHAWRLMMAGQRALEISAVVGSRYTEHLAGIWGVGASDSRMQRPEYIDGMTLPLIISEVLATAEGATTELGAQAGHGLAYRRARLSSYRVPEEGLIMMVLSIVCDASYSQGIEPQWSRKTREELVNPVYARLGEVGVPRKEIYATTVEADNNTLFGYRPIYDEMRYLRDKVTGGMRDDYAFLHNGRFFAAPPALNDSFLLHNPRKDIFPATGEPAFRVHFGLMATTIVPLPTRGDAGGV